MTVRLVVDEHISGALMRGLRLLVEDVDVVRVQDVGLRMATDQAILDWAATEGRILVTQDIRTMPDFAYDRVNAGLAMPGVAVLPPGLPMGVAIEELAVMVVASESDEWADRVVYLPLR